MVNLQVSGLSAESPERGMTFSPREREVMRRIFAIPTETPNSDINYYILLGIPAKLRNSTDTIGAKADTLMAALKNMQNGPFATESQSLLNKVSAAAGVLLNPEQKSVYDKSLTSPALIILDEGTDMTRKQAAEILPTIVVASSTKKERQSWLAKNWKTATGVAGTITTGIALAAAAIVSGAGNEKKETPATDPATPVVRTAAAGEGPRPSITKETVPPTEPVPTPKPTASAADVTPIALAPDNQPGISEASIQIPPASPTFAVGFNPPEEQQEPARAVPKQPRSLGELLAANPSSPATNPPPFTQPAATEETRKEVVLDPEKIKLREAEVKDFLKEKTGADKTKALTELLETDDVQHEPESHRVVLTAAFSAAIEEENIMTALEMVRRMQRIAPPFSKDELLENGKRILRIPIQKGDRQQTIMLSNQLQSLGVIDNATSIAARAAVIKNEIKMNKDWKKPANSENRVQVANELLELAREAADVDANKATALLKEANDALLPQQNLNVLKKFKEQAATVQNLIKAQRDYDAALVTLSTDPTNAKALGIRGRRFLSDGEIEKALRDLAQSNDPLNAQALRTTTLLNETNPSGKECLALAKIWKQQGQKDLASQLAQKALESKSDPLGAIDRVSAQSLTNGVAVAAQSNANGGNGGKVESVREPMRPKYVPKEAEWNPETGSWYLIAPNRMTITEGERLATANNATIAIIDSANENEIVRRFANGENQWLGVTKKPRDGFLYLPDGSKAIYMNWGGDEGKNPNEPYVQMNGDDGGWQDYPAEGTARVCLEWKAR